MVTIPEAAAWPRYFNEAIETIGPDKLRALQDDKLARQLRYVFERSTFYREKLLRAGVGPADIRSIDDLHRLPFTEKSELREALLEQPPALGSNQTAPIETIVRIHASSGSTGRPTYVGLTKKDSDLWTESCGRAFWTLGIRPDDIVMHAWNYSLFVGGVADHLGCEITGATMVPMGVGQSVRLVRVAHDLGATVANLTPSYAVYLAQVVRQELGIEPAELGLKRIVVGGEPGGGIPSTRGQLETLWNADVREAYGMVDIHPIVGAECSVKEGMHFLASDLVYPELLDLETGELIEMRPGIRGEVVYTALEREANPLLRFRTHDVIEIYHVGRCECGRTGFRFKVVGRTDDMQIVKGVNVYPAAVEDVLRGVEGLTGHFAILLDRPGPHDHLDVLIEQAEAVPAERLPELKGHAERRIGQLLLFKANVTIVPPGSLPRFELKAKRVYRLYDGEPSPYQT